MRIESIFEGDVLEDDGGSSVGRKGADGVGLYRVERKNLVNMRFNHAGTEIKESEDGAENLGRFYG